MRNIKVPDSVIAHPQALYLVRGLPGSGKTTAAFILRGRLVDRGTDQALPLVFSADDWMVDGWGQYRYDPQALARCHARCLACTVARLGEGHSVLVANTFVAEWEMATYEAVAAALQIPCVVLRVESGLDDTTLAARNVHGVPPDRIRSMRAAFVPHPGEIIVTVTDE